MIGMDLLYRGLVREAAVKYLGEPEQWITLPLGEVYARLGRRGWQVPDPAPEPAALIRLLVEDELVPIPDFVPAKAEGEGVKEVPPASASVPRRKWTCPQGHAWTSLGVYTWEAAFDPPQVSAPLCPYCVIAFAAVMFPATELR